ncbi:MAG: Rrf2 family transcriptional regulator [Oscillospiraceae bacterium]|nr:Rrf2 family transcriptional regulator [Oscillospiraceae bacterium]MDD4369250.1 Rrf2 family transcriptional regulator [Oscillospiraceae bacterium]
MYSSKLSVSLHILSLVALEPCPITSEYIASSIGTNPALVRRLMSSLKRAGLLRTQTKLGAQGLGRPPEKIRMLDVFQAVEPETPLFDQHLATNPQCPVGAGINQILASVYSDLQQDLRHSLARISLQDVIQRFPASVRQYQAAASTAGNSSAERSNSMHIYLIGASGMAGSAIYQEALKRGHQVTAIVRDEARARKTLGEQADILPRDAFDLSRADLAAADVVIDAFSAPPARAYRQVDLAAHLVSLLRETERPRLLFILGAGSLLDQQERPFVETLKQLPEAASWIATPEAQLKELAFLRGVDNVNWVGVSPSAEFSPGPRHEPKVGRDHLLTAADGKSHVTNQTLAVAVLDELERPTIKQGRFTVSD